MENKKKKEIDRRDFLKILGTAGAAITVTGLPSCGNNKNSSSDNISGEKQPGEMTYRTHPTNGDRISILGYGCMRWPTISNSSARENGDEIDQETVNELVDYAVAHGVNYFDTAPVYVQGFSEKSTGIALKRHPREKVFVATKMSNYSNFTR